MSEHERIVELSRNVGTIANRKLISINSITHEIRIPALNALIEASRAGSAGVGFAVVAKEVKSVSHRITDISQEMSKELALSISELNKVGMNMMTQLEEARGQRLKNLALNVIDIIDRNLYEPGDECSAGCRSVGASPKSECGGHHALDFWRFYLAGER